MFSSRVRDLDVSGIRKLFEAARSDAIHLGIGEPHVQPPQHVIDAFVEAVRSGKNRYSPTAGLPELRQALADHYAGRWPGITTDHVGVTAGSTAALFGALYALVDEGAEVLVPDPGFVLYAPHTKLAGGTPVPYPLRHEEGFEPDLDAMAEAITDRTRAIIVNSPGNPTGVTLSEEAIAGVVDLAEDHDLWVLSDEAYDRITFDREHTSMLGRTEKLAYFNTFSKSYAMTGWRLGYFIGPPELARKVRVVCYHMYAAPSTPAQWAGLAALEGPDDAVVQMVAELRERRDLLVERLQGLPNVDLVTPTGAIYAFPRIYTPLTSMDLAMRLLEAGVVTVPGSAFGAQGEGHIRFSFATDPGRIEAGLQVVEKVLEEF